MDKKNLSKMGSRTLSLICFFLLIGIWCAASYSGAVDEIFLPSPTDVINKLISMAKDGSLLANCWESTARVLVG